MATTTIRKPKIIRLPISKQIDINFRNYALYVLERRGIPAWEDGLTSVQRLILLNAPDKFNKTLSLVGDCIKDGYHHGDSSLGGAIQKLARPFGCSDQLMLGDGFFGSPVKPEAAAPRYTQVRINPKYRDIIKENSFLNERDEEGAWKPLYVNEPIGLSTMVIGIAVGYKSTILPRKLEDIQKYQEGKIKEVKPYFRDFTGKIERYENMDKTWVLSGDVEVNDSIYTINIKDLPPIMKFDAFCSKIEKICDQFFNKVKVYNSPSTKADMRIVFTGVPNEWPAFKDAVLKSTKMLVTECPVFVKDGNVLVYDRLEDYFDDLKYRKKEIEVKRCAHFLAYDESELEYNKAKKKYLEYMLKKKRTEKEVEEFLKGFDEKISARLDCILLKRLNAEELKRVEELIDKLTKEIKEFKTSLKKLESEFSKMEDTAAKRGIQNKAVKDLFEDIEVIDGIEVFKGDDGEKADEDEEFDPNEL